MKNKITIRQMAEASDALYVEGKRFTHIGIGPMSRRLLRAALELAKEKDFPLILIASRNQVDSDALGGGYVCGFDQKRFVEATAQIADEIGFDGLCYFCRDHGGPWQRDKERADKLPAMEAMEIAKQSYLDDAASGFDLLHIDPTKDPHCAGVVPLDTVLNRTVELIEYVEKKRKELNLQELAYEVGTEETAGGLIDPANYESFIRTLNAGLDKRRLPRPIFVVGQTGTLVRLTSNVGHYDTQAACTLSGIARKHGMGLKQHNGDYLENAMLLEHPAIGLSASNVAPEFGVVETEAYLELLKIEEKFVGADKRSNLGAVLKEYAVKGERWRKWMVGDKRNACAAEIMDDAENAELITRMCGHYTFEEPAVSHAIVKLEKNIQSLGLDPDFYVLKRIKDCIDRYVYCFNLYGTTTRILEKARAI
ncbi:MAG: class II D-tagatose-bisphosphate aldolase, non-catalytic subunit [Firmicutes bacterium]|nr:class II D-tagatose-bisphosphate aldolase, non-catalytic subunit [Bacillota bacterium]